MGSALSSKYSERKSLVEMAINNSIEAQKAIKETLLSLHTFKEFCGVDLFAKVVRMSRGAKQLAEFLEAMHRVRIGAGAEELKALAAALHIVDKAVDEGRICSDSALALVDKVVSWWRYYG